jgi:hypothetical protein
MTDYLTKMKVPLQMYGVVSNKDACKRMREGIERNEPIIAFPHYLYLVTILFNSFPIRLREVSLEYRREGLEMSCALVL